MGDWVAQNPPTLCGRAPKGSERLPLNKPSYKGGVPLLDGARPVYSTPLSYSTHVSRRRHSTQLRRGAAGVKPRSCS